MCNVIYLQERTSGSRKRRFRLNQREEKGREENLRPCQIGNSTKMPSDRLRQKAVLTAIEAVRKSENYQDSADHIKMRFDDKQVETWSCFIRHIEETKATTYSTRVCRSNFIWLRIGECDIALWQSKDKK